MSALKYNKPKPASMKKKKNQTYPIDSEISYFK